MKRYLCISCPDCRKFLGPLKLAKETELDINGKIKPCPECDCDSTKFKKEYVYFCDSCTTRSPDKRRVAHCELVHQTMNLLEFEITQEHLSLIQNLNFKFNQYCEFGAGCVDPKRPYGNSDVYTDIAEHLGIKPEGKVYDSDDEHEWREFTDEQEDYLWKIHVEAVLALEICSLLQNFETGVYTRKYSYCADWKRDNSLSFNKRCCNNCKNGSCFRQCEKLLQISEYNEICSDEVEEASFSSKRTRKQYDFKENHCCDTFENKWLEYPIAIKEVIVEPIDYFKHKRDKQLVKIRPCADEYNDETFLGFYLGELPTSISQSFQPKDHVLTISTHTNPAIYVPKLNKIIFGCESWWSAIKSENDLADITDETIDNQWYVKMLKKP